MSSKAPKEMKTPARTPDTKIFETGELAFMTPTFTAASNVFAGLSAPGMGSSAGRVTYVGPGDGSPGLTAPNGDRQCCSLMNPIARRCRAYLNQLTQCEAWASPRRGRRVVSQACMAVRHGSKCTDASHSGGWKTCCKAWCVVLLRAGDVWSGKWCVDVECCG
jgi:hypothetical protein